MVTHVTIASVITAFKTMHMGCWHVSNLWTTAPLSLPDLPWSLPSLAWQRSLHKLHCTKYIIPEGPHLHSLSRAMPEPPHRSIYRKPSSAVPSPTTCWSKNRLIWSCWASNMVGETRPQVLNHSEMFSPADPNPKVTEAFTHLTFYNLSKLFFCIKSLNMSTNGKKLFNKYK